jgi:NAD(P)H-flavin reductase
MNNTIPITAVVTGIQPLTDDTSLFTLRIRSDHPVASSFLPGQFLQLSLPGVGEIPVSYCGYPSLDGSIELCIRHVGHVTIPLKSAAIGAVVGVRGPFGVGFPLPLYAGRDLLLIAGGLGMAPIRSLLLALLNQQDSCGRLIVLYGSREIEVLLFLRELLELQKLDKIELHLAVDHPGKNIESLPDCRVALLPALLDQLDINSDQTCAAICGPPVVYQPLVSGLLALGLQVDRMHLSLERRMKCGVGRCGHCAVGSLLCCLDGPVFSFADLAGIEGALE